MARMPLTTFQPGCLCEDLGSMETRLACIEVVALGARSPHEKLNVDYYAARLVLIRLTADVAALVTERGAVGGATLNMIFPDHFHRVARGHFTVRRLERIYGTQVIRGLYQQSTRALSPRRPLLFAGGLLVLFVVASVLRARRPWLTYVRAFT